MSRYAIFTHPRTAEDIGAVVLPDDVTLHGGAIALARAENSSVCDCLVVFTDCPPTLYLALDDATEACILNETAA